MTRREWLAAFAGLGPAGMVAARKAFAQAPPVPSDPTMLSISELGAAFDSGRLTPVEVTAAYLRRIESDNLALGAFVTVSRERAADDTRRVMTRLTAGDGRGPLTGVPVAHKDLFATKGIRTTGGSKLHEDWVPERDAAVVARLSAAGTVLLGKTNTHELGGGVTTINPFFGTTHNPRNLARIPGGSSGGSAAAVVARLVLVATGSDTGGSVRIPAALCGCVGLKPTFGLLPTDGLLGACPTFDHVGLLTRSVDDAAHVLLTLAGSRPVGAPATDYRAGLTRGVKGLRIGVPRRYFFDTLEPGVRLSVEHALERLRAGGALVRDIALPVDGQLYDTMFEPIAVSEIRATYARDWAVRPDAFSKDFATVFAGPGPSVSVVARARVARAAFQRATEARFATVDVLAMPAVPIVAPRIDGAIDGMRILHNTWPFNAARVPALSVPCGTGEAGLPVGLQLVGRMSEEHVLLQVAATVERACASACP